MKDLIVYGRKKNKKKETYNICYRKKENRTFNNGRMSGTQEDFYISGQLQNIYNMKNGKKEGLREEYWENGKNKLRGNYKDGIRDGLWTFWDYHDGKEYKGNEGEVIDIDEIPKLIKSEEIDHSLVISAFYFLDRFKK